MGCDIHMWAEIRRNLWGNEWATVGRVFPNPHYREEGVPTIDEDGDAWGEPLTMHPYSDRNYVLFSVLAGVRNDADLAPIAEPRGLPADLSPYLAARVDDVEHTPSWLTLEEIEAYDWSQKAPTWYGGTLAEAAGSFYSETLPKLREIRQSPGVTGLRLVFWFDS